MIQASDNAIKELRAYFSGKEVSPVRVFLAPGGCSGPKLALALDEARDTDEVFDVEEFTFVMEKDLHEEAQPVSIDMSHMGFVIESSLQLGGSCGSGGCSSGGCGSGGSSCCC